LAARRKVWCSTTQPPLYGCLRWVGYIVYPVWQVYKFVDIFGCGLWLQRGATCDTTTLARERGRHAAGALLAWRWPRWDRRGGAQAWFSPVSSLRGLSIRRGVKRKPKGGRRRNNCAARLARQISGMA